MQFYKKRDFGNLIGDTFTFVKLYGRNFFRNYLLINGILLIALVAMFVIGYRSIFAQILEGNMQGQSYYFESYFDENPVMLIAGALLFFIIFFGAIMIMYSFPVLYMKRLSETGNRNITADLLLSDLKKNAGKFFIYFFGILLIMLPLMLAFFAMSSILFFVGFFLIMLAMPIFVNVNNFTLFDYFHTKRGFFSSLSYAFRSQFSYPDASHGSPFWKYWGSTIIVYMIITIISYIFTLIPMAIFMGAMLTVPDGGAQNLNDPSMFFQGTIGILFFVIYGFSLLFMMLMSNLLYINSGLSYYDSRTDLHRSIDLQEIDTIGNSEA